MAIPVITGQENAKTAVAMRRVHLRNGGREAHQIVELARRYTQSAIRKMADLMEGKAGKIKTLDKEGTLVEIDVEVPASVQLKAAEILLERGYGKAPQAILLKGDGLLPVVDAKTMTVAEKIVALSQALEQKAETRDLEASEIREVELTPPNYQEDDVIDLPESPKSEEPAVTAADLI